MAYTRTWSDATPAGTRAANQIDDAIREFKVDVHERMDDLVVDWLADPVVLNDQYKGTVTDKYVFIPPHLFTTGDDEDNNNWRDNHFQPDASVVARCAVTMPQGVTITQFDFVSQRGTANVVAVFSRQVYSTGVLTTLDTVTNSTPVTITLSTGIALTEVTDSDRFYTVAITNPGSLVSCKIYGCRIRYSVPDSRNTI